MATKASLSSGNWSDPNIWNPTGVPANLDDVTISSGHTVVFDVDQSSFTDGLNSLTINGTLTVSTSVNTHLKMRGNVTIASSGVFQQGTVANPIPAGVTHEVTLNQNGVNVNYSITCNGTWVAQGASKPEFWCLLSQTVNAGATTIYVDRATGWKAGDQIVIASTSTSYNSHDLRTLSTDAGESSLSVTSGLTYTHEKSDPYINAEIINLTRNIKIHGQSTSLQGYIVLGSTAVVDWDWIEIYWMGSATTGKRGIEISSTTNNNVSIRYCSIHDFRVTSSNGINVTSSAAVDLKYNVSFYIDYYAYSLNAGTAVVPPSDSIVIYGPNAYATGVYQSSSNYNVTNSISNMRISGTAYAIYIGGGDSAVPINSCVLHSCRNHLCYIASKYCGTIDSTWFVRSAGTGRGIYVLSFAVNGMQVKNSAFVSLSGEGIFVGYSGIVWVSGCTFSSCVNADIHVEAGGGVYATNCSFSNSRPIRKGGSNVSTFAIADNCTFSTIPTYFDVAGSRPNPNSKLPYLLSFIRSMRHNGYSNRFVEIRDYGRTMDQVTAGYPESWAYGGSGRCLVLDPTSTTDPLVFYFYLPVGSSSFKVQFYKKVTLTTNGPSLKLTVWDVDHSTVLLDAATVSLGSDWELYQSPTLTPSGAGTVLCLLECFDGPLGLGGVVGIDQIGLDPGTRVDLGNLDRFLPQEPGMLFVDATATGGAGPYRYGSA